MGLDFTPLSEYSVEEITEHLELLGYSVIKTTELETLEESWSNHPG